MKRNIAIIENNIISTLTVRSKLTKVLIDEGHKVTILTTGTEQQFQKAKEQGFDVMATREPGGIEIAEQIRKVIGIFRAASIGR